MAEGNELVMSFDPNTIEHLGVKMYSQIPTALAELIANAYDADAGNVLVHLFDDGEEKRITVKDDGFGMTFDEVNNDFLRIGRNRRDEGKTTSPSGTRKATGKKGLGKLALFGIGDTIEVITIKNKQKVHFRMSWSSIKHTPAGTNYKPEIIVSEETDANPGTQIILSDLKRKSPFNIDDLAVSLSKLFNFFDNNFKVVITDASNSVAVTKELRYSSIESQFEFDVPDFCVLTDDEYTHKNEIKGSILTTEKPLKPGLRGVTLFANGRLVNAPEFFGRSESSHFYSYATGWIEVDFIDDWELDVISTNRQSINWGFDETERLRDFLQKIIFSIERNWREKRKEESKAKITTDTNINLDIWYDKLPEDIQPSVEKIINNVVKKELTKDDQNETVQELNKLIPAYPYYHWRHLHEEIRGASLSYYQNKDFYGAFLESVKKYANATRAKSGVPHGICDDDLMAKSFHITSGSLTVTPNYLRINGQAFPPATLKNIQEGHFNFSKGVIAGGRNPVAHEEIKDLRESGLFSEKDCLDLLSLLSHLFKRLDDAETRTSS